MRLTIPERRVLEIWRDALQKRKDLVTAETGPVNIVYAGRFNDGRGADLRDAVVATDRGLLQGDIEIHVNSSDWWAHGHHEDRAYNSVVLHVVYRHDAGRETVLQNGLEIPTLALEEYAEEQPGDRITSAFTPIAAGACRATPELADRCLDEAGDARFYTGAARFQREIIRLGPEQALYAGIMTALGYSKNKAPMAELARAAPLADLEKIVGEDGTDGEGRLRLQARLLGAAGLLPSQRPRGRPTAGPPDEYERTMEQFWEKSGLTARMCRDDWVFFKVRLGNYPVRRIAAMGALLARHSGSGILQALLESLENAERDARSLEEALLVPADGYWERYADFAIPLPGRAALLGKERAGEIIINALLPFYAAYARLRPAAGLAEKAYEIFSRYRAPAENSLEKHMRRQLGIAAATVATARRRQGLIHIYKTLCTQGRCGECPLGNRA